MADTPTVQAAWAAVMGEVRELGKNRRTDSGNRFNFRGVDDVMNLVGPVLRKHGVAVVPTAVTHSPEDVTTTKGARMRNVTVIVTYAIVGPAGDTIPGAAAGEAADSGDKATPKAMSVAYRTFLLQSLCLPTDEQDPDQHQYERGDQQQAPPPDPGQQAQDTADRLAAADDAEAVARVRAWAGERDLLDLMVTDHEGNGVPLAQVFDHTERRLAA